MLCFLSFVLEFKKKVPYILEILKPCKGYTLQTFSSKFSALFWFCVWCFMFFLNKYFCSQLYQSFLYCPWSLSHSYEVKKKFIHVVHVWFHFFICKFLVHLEFISVYGVR